MVALSFALAGQKAGLASLFDVEQVAGVDRGFRAVHRLLKTDEFSSVFAFRRSFRGGPFQLLYCENGRESARLGIVVGKKFAPLSVTRNRIKRLAREAFRHVRGELPACDVVIRLSARLADGVEVRSELDRLLRRLKGDVKSRGERPAPGVFRGR